jgi:hypothetical protein
VTAGFEVHPVTPKRWPDMVELFERRGPRGGHRNSPAYGCWCMYWRDRSLRHGTPKKRAMGALVRAGCEPGLLGYDEGSPLGWVSIAPREEFTAILRSPQYRPHDEDDSRDYMGSVPLYESAGFSRLRDANKRAIYRREP